MADHGLLKSRHTFSFANYYNSERIHFGVLRVLNDDFVEPGMGFGTHPHNNMEIISIPLEGDLEHRDSMGNVAVIRNGDVQVMSAGSRITHSEYNKNNDQPVKFLQIWIIPNKKDVNPRYDQITLTLSERHNRFQQILSPDPGDEGVWIHQDAWFHMGKFDKDFPLTYSFKKKGNGLYIFVLRGKFRVNETILGERDGMGVTGLEELHFRALIQDAEILLMEVPMVV